MKRFIITPIIILVTILSFGQSEKWKQKNARINFAITPQAEYVKIGGEFSPAASLSGLIAFNDTYYIGGYLTKKVMPHYINYDYLPTTELDANFQHGGLEFLYAMKLRLYRTKGGHYVHPKMRLLFGSRVGAGLVWLDDNTKTRFTKSDYFGYIQPMVGVLYPIGNYITLQGGACFSTTIKIQKLDMYFKNDAFMMAGAFLGVKFYIFR